MTGSLVVGVGRRGRLHIETILRRGDERLFPVLALDRDPPSRSAYLLDHPAVKFVTKEQAYRLLDRINLAVIATPPEAHWEYLAQLAAQVPKVLVEKPAVADRGELAAVSLMSREEVGRVYVGYSERHNPAATATRRSLSVLVRKATVAINFLRVRPPPPAGCNSDVGQELAVHDLDFVLNDLIAGPAMEHQITRSDQGIRICIAAPSGHRFSIEAYWWPDVEETTARVCFDQDRAAVYRLQKPGRASRLAALNLQLERVRNSSTPSSDLDRELRTLGMLYGYH
jgi:predicted dehydrogenase